MKSSLLVVVKANVILPYDVAASTSPLVNGCYHQPLCWLNRARWNLYGFFHCPHNIVVIVQTLIIWRLHDYYMYTGRYRLVLLLLMIYSFRFHRFCLVLVILATSERIFLESSLDCWHNGFDCFQNVLHFSYWLKAFVALIHQSFRVPWPNCLNPLMF